MFISSASLSMISIISGPVERESMTYTFRPGLSDSYINAADLAELYAPDRLLVVAKQVLNMENISALLTLQKATYSTEMAYDYFCEELEYMIRMTFEKKSEQDTYIAYLLAVYVSCFIFTIDASALIYSC